MKEKYIDLLVKALALFYKNDAAVLFSDKTVHEQAMVGCIARYVWCLQKMSGLVGDVDVEYDKIHLHDPKAFYGLEEHKNSCCNDMYELCGGIITDKINKHTMQCNQCERRDSCKRKGKKYKFRPDLILHKRNSDQNWLVVEFKKMQDLKKKKSEFEFDVAKLRACTCKKRDFGYEVGAFVILDKECAHMKVFVDSKKNEAFWIDKEGQRHDYNEENREPCSLSK